MRSLLISVDGLSSFNLSVLINRLSKSGPRITQAKIVTLDSEPLTSAQAIWAEIFTGQPWYSNGCFGFSHPTTSLNALSVFTEKELSRPQRLLRRADGQSSSNIVINAPLLKPAKGRLWLSDGSMPLNALVSPSTLANAQVLSRYRPRPFAQIAAVIGARNENAAKCVKSEAQRLECASFLLKEHSWRQCIWRMTIFDELTHLYGIDWLDVNDYAIAPQIDELLSKLDAVLSDLYQAQDTSINIISAFSHSPCTNRLNLNRLLEEGGFLETAPSDSSHRHDTRRIAAQTAVSQGVARSLLRSAEGIINTKTSVAASPVYGTIFINTKKFFADGIVDISEHQGLCDELHDYLKKILERNFGSLAKIVRNPRPIADRESPTPDLILSIDGVEFTDIKDPSISEAQTPLTTHRDKGFATVPSTHSSPDSLKPFQLLEVLREF